MLTRENDDISDENSTTNSKESAEPEDFLNKDCFKYNTDALNKLKNEEEVSALDTDVSSGAKMIKVGDGEQVFLSQLESYFHRGDNFQSFTLIEFECEIIAL